MPTFQAIVLTADGLEFFGVDAALLLITSSIQVWLVFVPAQVHAIYRTRDS